MAEFEPDPRFPSETQRMEERQAEIEQCLRQIKSKDPRARSQAAKRLGDLRAEPKVLLAVLEDFNPYVRSAAAFALGFATTPEVTDEVVEGLLGMIDDTNDYVCASAIHSLGVIQAEAAREQILACLEDDNPVIVQAAILAAARIGPESLGERLAAFLDSDQYLVLLAATRAVYLLNYAPAAPRLLAKLAETLQARNQKDFKLPKAYIETLARLQYGEAVPVLIEAAGSAVGLRSVAVEALIKLKADQAAPLLAPLLTEPSEGLRRHLVEMMVAADYHAALPVIRGLLRDPSAQIRDVALVAVSTWKDRAAIEQVRQMAQADPNPFVRPQAIACLAAVLAEEAIPDLQALLEDPNVYVRQAASESLERLGCLPILEGEELPATGAASAAQARGIAAGMNGDPKPGRVFPVTVERERLLPLLEAWQTDLAQMARTYTVEEIAEMDAALTKLIQFLRK